MVSATRSSQKNEVNGDSRKKEIRYGKGSPRCSFRKTDVSGAMKASREKSLSREMTQNSQIKQKSLRLNKPISPSTPRITNQSKRHEKQSTPSPLRRSVRNKKNMSSSSNIKLSVREFTGSNLVREKDKTESLIQVLVDTEKTESALESVGVKRKNMDARSFKYLFKRQQIKIPELCHGDGLKDNSSNSSVRETYDDSERLPTNCLAATNTNAPVTRSSACLESSQYRAISTENGEICLEMKEIIPSSSAKCETPSLLGTCLVCHKNKRVSDCSPEEELCSCSATLDDGLRNITPSEVSENEFHRHLLYTELQDQEPAVEIPSTLHIEVATLELVDTTVVFQSNLEESTTGNHELLHALVVDASISCNQSHLSEMEHPIQNKKRSPSQSAAARETAELFDVFISQSCEPSQLEGSHLDLGQLSRFNNDQSMVMFACSPNNTAIAEAVVSTSELPNQAVQLTLDSGRFHDPKNLLAHPIQQVASWNSIPSSLAEPLEDEVERLHKEVEQLEKTYENVMSQLKSDCEKEIEEIIAQIQSKYEAKIKDAEAGFRLKRNEVEKNQNIILMNKKLAEAFRSKCVDFKASRRPGMQPAFPSGFKPLPSTRLSSAASASRPPRQRTAAPFQLMLPHQPIPHSASSPVASKNVATPPAVLTGPQISGCSSRPPVISGITSAANPHVGREKYSPAPHLQSFAHAAPPLVGGQIRSPAPHLHPFRSAAPPYVGGETRSQGSHFQPFRPAAPTSRVLHQHLPKQKYRRLDQLP